MSGFVFSVDLEAAGPYASRNGFTEIGAVLKSVSDGNVIDEFHSYASMKGFEWDPECVETFWKTKVSKERRAETIDACYNDYADSPYDVIRRFYEWIDKWVSNEWIRQNTNVITDNPSFDISLIHHFSVGRSMLYIFGEYRPILDTASVFKGMSLKELTPALIRDPYTSSKQMGMTGLNKIRKLYGFQYKLYFPYGYDMDSHLHNPVKDANRIADYWCFFQRELAKLESMKMILEDVD